MQLVLSRLLQISVIGIFAAGIAAPIARPATVLVLVFHNNSQSPDLAWVGESVSQTLKDELSAHNQITFGREAQAEALRRLDLRPRADYTKATLIRLGQALDVNFVCYGSFEATLPTGDFDVKHSNIQVNAHFLDLRKLHEGPDLAEAGKLIDLARIEEHLAWQSLRYLDPQTDLPLDKFLAPAKLIPVEAEESYIRGLISVNKDQQKKWFTQALALDPRFSNPAFELGALALERREYRQAIGWFGRVSSTTDPRYPSARFKLGLAAYGAADYATAADSFRTLSKLYPLNEVFNDLGAAENQMNAPEATPDFKRAVDGDPNDPVYLFNLGNALLKANHFDEASDRFQAVLSHAPDDEEAQMLLGRSQRHEFTSPGSKPLAPDRLKTNFELSAYQQLKAMVQSKGSE